MYACMYVCQSVAKAKKQNKKMQTLFKCKMELIKNYM